MLEFCSRKRMIVGIILLGLLTILFLILEEALTSQEHAPTPTSINSDKSMDNVKHIPSLEHYRNTISEKPSDLASKSDSDVKKSATISPADLPCWLTETFTIVETCSHCTSFEIESGSKPACIETGLKEKINCSSKGLVYRSCSRIPEVEKRRFLIFESLMLLVTVVSYGIVKLRTSQLERIASKQMEKRLASSY